MRQTHANVGGVKTTLRKWLYFFFRYFFFCSHYNIRVTRYWLKLGATYVHHAKFPSYPEVPYEVLHIAVLSLVLHFT